MSERRARYQLRIQLLPGPDLPERAAELATFCREHAIDEAVLFVAAEEWNDGLIDDQQLEAWYAALALAKQTLEAEGITVSLNPWYTVLHTDRGRHMPSGYSFTPMVSPGGRKARAVASFACPNWLAYIRHMYMAAWPNLAFASSGLRMTFATITTSPWIGAATSARQCSAVSQRR
jgi:hypothetical protein